MIDLVIARSDLLDEPTFERMRAAVSAERRQRSDRYHRRRDRYASVVVFSLLQHLWQGRLSGPMPEIDLGAFGKPRFQGRGDWHFNWSHDSSVCVCALSPMPIGVDVQSRVPFDDALFERIAAPGELRLRDRYRRANDLSPLWTRKEALVKRTGRGLSIPLRDIDTFAAQDIATFSCSESDVRISISATGLSEQALLSRLRIRRVHPSQVSGWTDAVSAPVRLKTVGAEAR
jgi:4'-phosphopantetheinyl transferase